jgi:hypothetical protein
MLASVSLYRGVYTSPSGNSQNPDVPYIANYIYEHPDLDFNLKGIWIADPSLSYDAVQEEIPALRFAQANRNVFPFNSSFYAHLQNISDTCGYTSYLDDFVTYPPKGQLPLPVGVPEGTFQVSRSCRIFDPIINEISMCVYVWRSVVEAVHDPMQQFESCLQYLSSDGKSI